MNDCWIFDVDGTLSDPTHRKHWIASKPRNWNAWNAGMSLDKPQLDVIAFMSVARSMGLSVVISTGREETHRDVTDRWFRNYGIGYQAMYMRKTKDYRDDSIVKKEMLDLMRKEGYNPVLVFDDRDRVVKMWREKGLRCFQVQEGNF